MYLRLFGTIDERFDPRELMDNCEGKDVILNLKSVDRMSSFGVREWVRAMELMTENAKQVYWVECSPSVVSQLNMISNFAAGSRVVSVQAPFYCDACGWDTELTYELNGETLPPVACQRCKEAMELDDDESAYFGFNDEPQSSELSYDVVAFIRSFKDNDDSEDDADATADPVLSPPKAKAPSRGTVLKNNPVLVVGAIALALVVVVVAMALSRGGIPPEHMMSYHDHLEAGDYEAAKGVVNELVAEGIIDEPLARPYLEGVDRARDVRIAELRRKMTEARRAKKFDEVFAVATELDSRSGWDPTSAFMAAEAYRIGKDVSEAAPYYEKFTQLVGNSGDRRLDDAWFWLAEASIRNDDTDKAVELWRKIVAEFPRGSFRKNAVRKLKKYSQ